MCIILQTFNVSHIWYRHSYIDQAIYKQKHFAIAVWL